jgi:lipopolysaccharide transport system ATP-binding protein
MSDIVIKVENIWKEYCLGVVSHHSMAKDLQSWWARMRGKDDPNAPVGTTGQSLKSLKTLNASTSSTPPSPFTFHPSQSSTPSPFTLHPSQSASADPDRFWALRDVSFEVRQGERIGIIGRNGAGKSTLLKILSNVTTPTRGQVTYKGRIASLLEVGTGFHPELTGKENIFLNGAILGMTKNDIRRKFDEIVDFSGVEKFIDTPVKRYSSGMYVRLAFAVAAHLEPEILVVDEVLAVGDSEFQKKCLGKMEDVSKQGRTVLFVSHNMGAIKSLCQNGILLNEGSVSLSGNVDNVIEGYSETIKLFQKNIPIAERTDRQGNGDFYIQKFNLLNSSGDDKEFHEGQIGFNLEYYAKHDLFSCKILISINNSVGECIIFMDSTTINDFPGKIGKKGEFAIKITPDFGLADGGYFVNVAVFVNDNMADYVQNALIFHVDKGSFYEGGKTPAGKGMCYVKQEWKYHPL